MLIPLLAACLASCSHPAETGGRVPATSVTLTRVGHGHIRRDIVLSATTAYLRKTSVTAPVAGYVQEIHVRPGATVGRGQPLYTLESKEQRALASTSMPPITVCAGEDGIVLDVLQQTDSYVPEGTPLCSLVATDSFVFLLDVPYEQSRHTAAGKACTLVLPDGTRLHATIGQALVTMNIASQSQAVMVRADNAPFLPEGMHVAALVSEEDAPLTPRMILPKRAVQSDEQLTHHWVMKLANDSTAIRIPVTVGNSTADSIEVSGSLTPEDRIILTGGYALPDSSRVVISP